LNGKISVNPLEVLLWNRRHSGKDIVKIYTKLAPLMQVGADTKMLNFGLWDGTSSLPAAQKKMTDYMSDFADFANAKKILDVGSGFCVPASIWKQKFPHLEIFCLDLNFDQLNHESKTGIVEPLNSSSDCLPFSDGMFDRVVALESAQHFTRLGEFFAESKRVLSDGGRLVIAIPIAADSELLALKLGILNITWVSKKYTKTRLLDAIKNSGLGIKKQESVGNLVYEPFADYYIQNRQALRQKLAETYSQNVESLIFKSMRKMKDLSERKVIDYLLLSLEKT
jgi:cyclopropane fatty-acyl-phospholipid synthase-like methyltransferase